MERMESFGRVKPVISNFDSKINNDKKNNTPTKTQSRFEELKRKKDAQTIGSYDSTMFKDGMHSTDSEVQSTTLKGTKSYKEFVERNLENNKTSEEQKDKPIKKNQELKNDFDNSNIVKSQRRQTVEPIHTLEGIEVINKDISLEYGSNSKPNYLYIENIENLNVKDYAIVGLVNNEPCFMNILGFTDKFELIFKIDCKTMLMTEGTSRFFKEHGQLYMGIEVNVFNKNKPIEVKINGRKLQIYFRELNKTYNKVKTENIYEIRLLRMSLI